MEEILSKWKEIIESIRIEHSLTDISYNTWLVPLKVYCIKDNTLYIQIPKELGQSLSYYNAKFLIAFKVAVNEALGSKIGEQLNVEFISEADIKNNIYLNNNVSDSEENFKKNKESYEKSNLNKNYKFENFVVGGNNRLAHASALAVADKPGEIYNPLFIYGGSGLGKTHLMQAIGHYIIDQNTSSNVLYVTSEQFTSDVVDAIRTANTSPTAIKKLREKYRNVDVLLIDDIQSIIGRDATQEEFFNTFNQLYEQKKQIVITSDKPPKDMEVLEDRFRSRFAWGLTVDIQFPDLDTRMAILQKKMEATSYKIKNDVLEYIATNVKSNIRELEGSLNKVILLSTLENKEIDIELAKEALKDIVSPDAPDKITPLNVIEVVCDHFSVSIEEIKSSKRNKELVYPRQIIMYLCRMETDITLKDIARLLGGRDHSTVIHGVNTITNLIETDENTKRTIDTIINKLKSN